MALNENSLWRNDWEKRPIRFKSGNKIKEYTNEILYVRKRKLDDFLKKSSENEKNCNEKNVAAQALFDCQSAGSNPTMGSPEANLTPSTMATAQHNTSAHKLDSFAEYKSLASARSDKPTLLIGFDSEWENTPSGRSLLTWQFAVIWEGALIEFIFVRNSKKLLTFDRAIGCILNYLEFKTVDKRNALEYVYCCDFNERGKPLEKTTADLNEARNNAVYVYRNGVFTHERIDQMSDRCLSRSNRDWSWFHVKYNFPKESRHNVCLVCHTGKVDISSLDRDKTDLLPELTEVQGGLVSMQAIRMEISSPKDIYCHNIYPLTLTVRDTMCHAPADRKSLKHLGEIVGVSKIDVPSEQKEHMALLLESDTARFFEYASTDSVITLLYISALYGYNNLPPITTTSAAAAAMKETIYTYLHCANEADFDFQYRGLKKMSHGKSKVEDRPGYIDNSSLEPVSDSANTVQYYASQAYHGGYNSCSEVGYFPRMTWDYDLQNAYPTAMCLVPDIDWYNPVCREFIDEEITLEKWCSYSPLTPFFGYIRFEFPASVKFPCIPINVEGSLVYPRTSKGMDGVYVAGSYVYLALKLGAKIFCKRGYILNTLRIPNSEKESRSLSAAVKQLVVDRTNAKKKCGKGSLVELILKMMVNSGYGKVSQAVVNKRSWNAKCDEMEDLGCSPITNPVSAALITSLVQCVLIAAQNQCALLGYMSCSVTTDGFISDCPESTLKTLDLYGLRKHMEEARLYLTDGSSAELWEAKHEQNDLVNFTTRGNVSLLPHGVCAHNSTKSGYISDSYEDRLWLMTQVLSRTDAVAYEDMVWTTFKEIVRGEEFSVKKQTRNIRMDYDMKRKPDRKSFSTDTVVLNNQTFQIAHFDTIPFEDVAEFEFYRQKKSLTKVLRTMEDWQVFWDKLSIQAGCKAKVRDMAWSVLNSCVMGYRAGLYKIPALDNCNTVEEKIAYINAHNDSKKQFKLSDWKNCRKPKRQANMLPLEMILGKLEELQQTSRNRE